MLINTTFWLNKDNILHPEIKNNFKWNKKIYSSISNWIENNNDKNIIKGIVKYITENEKLKLELLSSKYDDFILVTEIGENKYGKILTCLRSILKNKTIQLSKEIPFKWYCSSSTRDPELLYYGTLDYKSWEETKPNERWISETFKECYEPEWLIQRWSASLDNYDVQAGAILPQYPLNINNLPFPPKEIKNIVDLVINKYSKSVIKQMYPSVYELSQNLKFLEIIYEILLLINKDLNQSLETRIKIINILENYKKLSQNDLIGFSFAGFPHPMIRIECIIYNFLSKKLRYFNPHIINLSEIQTNLYLNGGITFYEINKLFEKISDSTPKYKDEDGNVFRPGWLYKKQKIALNKREQFLFSRDLPYLKNNYFENCNKKLKHIALK